MWFVALQPGQEQPCDCFDHADNIVHMGKTIAQKGAQGIRMSMLLLLGISPKLILISGFQPGHKPKETVNGDSGEAVHHG